MRDVIDRGGKVFPAGSEGIVAAHPDNLGRTASVVITKTGQEVLAAFDDLQVVPGGPRPIQDLIGDLLRPGALPLEPNTEPDPEVGVGDPDHNKRSFLTRLRRLLRTTRR